MKKAAITSPPDHSEVIVFPPVIPVTGFLFGIALEWLMPLAPAVTGSLRIIARSLGGVVFLLGVAGFAWMILTMKRARTPIHNARTPMMLVESGPFRFTRNPMYIFWIDWIRGPGGALRPTVVACIAGRCGRNDTLRRCAQGRGISRAPFR